MQPTSLTPLAYQTRRAHILQQIEELDNTAPTDPLFASINKVILRRKNTLLNELIQLEKQHRKLT